MLFAKLQRILELTKDYVVKHITFQMYRGTNSGLFSPIGIKAIGKRDNLAVQFYERDDGLFQFIEGLHCFLFSEVLTELLHHRVIFYTYSSVMGVERGKLINEDTSIIVNMMNLESLAKKLHLYKR